MLGLGLGINKLDYFGSAFSIDKSFYFDGVDEYFSADSLVANVSSDTVGTLSVMVKHTQVIPSLSAIICGFGDADAYTQLNINQQTNGKVRASLSYIGVTRWSVDTDNAIDLTSWTKIDVVQNGTQPVIYINGVAVAQTFTVVVDKTFFLDRMLNIDTFTIGGLIYNSSPVYRFDGYISQVSYLNTNLSQAQITELYNNGNPKNPQQLFGSNCKFFFNPDNRTGDTAQFSVVDSVNSITATSSNMEDADLSPLTPYSTILSDLVTKYNFLNAWSSENIGINGTTTTAYDYLGTHDLPNPAVANQPTFSGGDAEWNNNPSLAYTTDDYLSKAVSNYGITESSGSVTAVFKFTSSGVFQTILNAGDNTSTNRSIALIVNSLDKVFLNINAGASSSVFSHDTALTIGNLYVVTFSSEGTTGTGKCFINGVEVACVESGTNTGEWFDLVPTGFLDTLNIGCSIWNPSTTLRFFEGDIEFVGVSSETNATNILAMQNILINKYGI